MSTKHYRSGSVGLTDTNIIVYRGYEIRAAGDAILSSESVGAKRHIIKKDGKILNELSCLETAKSWVDEHIASKE
jgi:hypothetical protein